MHCSKRPFLVRSRDDVLTCARHMQADALAPIFLTSSVTGQVSLAGRLWFGELSSWMGTAVLSLWLQRMQLQRGCAPALQAPPDAPACRPAVQPALAVCSLDTYVH